MTSAFDAAGAFLGQLVSVDWRWIVLGVACHLAKTACRSRAWRNVIAAAYPASEVRWRHVYGAYLAGVGLNAVVPVRSGDLLRLFLVKRRTDGASYSTLAATLVVETIFDLAASATLLLWAVQTGVIPGLSDLARVPGIDASLLLAHPYATAALGAALVLGAVLLVRRLSDRIASFGRRVALGFAILGDGRRYVRSVVAWQGADWLLRLLAIFCFLQAYGVAVGLGPAADLESALLVQVAQSLSTLVPVTPAGLGTEQALAAYVLAGKAATSAVVGFSAGMRLALVGVNVAAAAGVLLLTLGTVRWRRQMEHEEAALALARAEAES
jgi:uncharacterized membrane protein YbhN (UPF0104 family)